MAVEEIVAIAATEASARTDRLLEIAVAHEEAVAWREAPQQVNLFAAEQEAFEPSRRVRLEVGCLGRAFLFEHLDASRLRDYGYGPEGEHEDTGSEADDQGHGDILTGLDRGSGIGRQTFRSASDNARRRNGLIARGALSRD